MDSQQNKYCIYKHTLKQDGRCYIGQTCLNPPSLRWGKDGNKYKDSPKFYNAIQKYGWDNFEHEILFDNLTQEEANQKEYECICQYDSQKNGFNIELGGGSHPRSEETKQKISQSKKGVPLSPEHIEKLKQAQKGEKNPNYGKPHSEETKAKIGAANHLALLGKHHSDETKLKMSYAHRKYNNYILCTETNKIYGCIREIELDLNKTCSHVSEVCKGKRKTAYGCHWRYLTAEERDRYLEYGSI